MRPYRYLVLALPVLLLATTALALPPPPPGETINRTYGGPGDDRARAVVVHDDGYAFAGTRTAEGDADAWLVRVDGAGTRQWSRTYGGAGDQTGFDLVRMADGHALAGQTVDGDDRDALLVRVGDDGQAQWTRTFGGPGNQSALALARAGDGVLLAGYTQTQEDADLDAWLVRVDANGRERWNRSYGTEDTDAARSVVRTDNGHVFAGVTDSPAVDGRDAWLVGINESGVVGMESVIGDNGTEGLWAVRPTDDGFVLAGGTDSYGAGGFDAWLLTTDRQGRIQRNVTVGGSEQERAHAAVPIAEGYLMGGTTTFGDGPADALRVGLNGSGDIRWSEIRGGNGTDVVWDVRSTDGGGRVFVGETSSTGAGGHDAWLVQLGTRQAPTETATAQPTTEPTGTRTPTDDATATSQPTVTDSPSPTAPATTTGPESPTPGPPSTAVDTPGFGLLVALLGLAIGVTRVVSP